MLANHRSLLVVAAVAVVSSAACEGDTTVLLTVKGEPSRVAALSGRIIGGTGPVGPVHRFSNGEVVLPGTVLLKTNPSTARLGIVLWAEDASGKIVSQARSGACFEVVSGSQSKYQITMMPAQAGWSPAIAEQCYCNERMPGSDMCPPGGIPDDIKNQQSGTSGTGTGGSGGGSGSTGGSGGSIGGTGGTVGGAGGSANGGAGGTSTTGGTGGTAAGGAGGASTGGAGGAATGGMAMAGSGGIATGGSGVPLTNSLFSFDTAADWTMDGGTVTADATVKSQGAASISFTVASKSAIRSRAFATSEVPGATSKISLDVYFETAQNNQSNIQMWFECVAANVYNGYIEYKAVGGIAAKTWSPVVFTMPAPVAAAFKGNFTGCKLWMDVDVSGVVRFDNLGFVP